MMTEIFTYLGYVALSLAAFYGVYYLLLRNSTLFHFNRSYLLLALGMSFVLPLMNASFLAIDAYRLPEPSLLLPTDQLADLPPPGTVPASVTIQPTWQDRALEAVPFVMLGLYSLGVMFFLAKLCMNLYHIHRLKGKAEVMQKGKGYTIYRTSDISHPSSFMSSVFIPERLSDDDSLQAILRHEAAHVAQRHSLDMILAEITLALQWFNPFAWAWKGRLVEVHEYLADEATIAGTEGPAMDRRTYQKTLVAFCLSRKPPQLTHTFSQPSLKNRIHMMNRKRNKAITALRALVALPICLALLMLWAEKAEARMDYGQTTSLQAIQDPIYVVDGKVYASIDHIASDNILTIDVTADPEIVFMYGGTAGQDVVQIVLKEKIHPIEEDAHLLEETMEPSSPSVGQDQPLYILEGVEIDHTTANNIDPNDIKIVRVYKDDEAAKRYGEKARNGVVEIYLKNSQQEITEQHPEPDMNEEYAVEFAPIQEPSPDTDELQGAVTSPLKSQEMISHKAFPVPAHETLTIAYNTHNLTGDVTIDLLDLQGKKVASQSGLPSGNSSTSFELGALPNGTYLYTVTVDNQTAATGKVVVNK